MIQVNRDRLREWTKPVHQVQCRLQKWHRTIVHRDSAESTDGVIDRRHANPGQPPLLREHLRAALAGPVPNDGLWTRRKVAGWMAERYPTLRADRHTIKVHTHEHWYSRERRPRKTQ